MVGHSEAKMIQSFGLPTRGENIEGHQILISEESDEWPAQRGGTWSRPARLGQHGHGTVALECRANFAWWPGS
jgi:hypothetical protein